MKQKRVQDMTTSEKAEAFVTRVVLDKDVPQCSINKELEIIESTVLRVTWEICPVIEEILKNLKTRGFNFRSLRGVELLLALKRRYLSPEEFGYSRNEVRELYLLVFENTGISLLGIHE